MADHNQKYILYHDHSSLCSIMARYTYALHGSPLNPNAAMEVEEQVCSLKNREQLTEHFLCDINAKGEVPVLVPANGKGAPIPDSVDITYAFAARYPSLMPEAKEGEVKRLIGRLHEINFFSLTFAGKPEVQQRNSAVLEAKLEEEISEKYREAIVHKIERIRSRKLDALEPQNVQIAVDSTKEYLAEIARLLERSSSGWILDTTEPTALDAHLVCFFCRLQDIHREALIPDTVQRFAEVAMAQPAWKAVMEGRRTVPAPND